MNIFKRLLCYYNGGHEFKQDDVWDKDASSLYPCQTCGIIKKHYKEGEFIDADGNECFRFYDGSYIKSMRVK